MGSRALDWGVSTTFSPDHIVFVQGRMRVCVPGLRRERVKWALAGLVVTERSDEADARSSPSRHWPQKANSAQAATAASLGCVRSRFSMRNRSMAVMMGGRGGSLE